MCPKNPLNIDNWKKENMTHLLDNTIIDIFVEKVNSRAIVKNNNNNI